MILLCHKFCVTSKDSIRWQVFQKRFNKLSIEPVYHNGRYYSHVCTEIVKTNLDKDCFMIFEDDACPVNEAFIEEIKEIERQLTQIPFHWDVLYLGCHLLGGNGKFITKNILHQIQPYCTQAVLYRSSAYPTLLKLIEENPLVRGHAWDEMLCNSSLVKITASPMIITQEELTYSLEKNLHIHTIMQKSHENIATASIKCNLSSVINQNKNIYNIKPDVAPDLQGWGSESIVFKYVLEKIKPELIVEVGSWKGASAIHMAKVCKELGYESQILCIDTWLGSEEYYTNLTNWHDHLAKKSGYPSVYNTFLANVIENKMEECITPFPVTSIIGAKVLKYHGIQPDVVYLDASHDYESVKVDLNLYYDLLKPGGILIGDDHSSTWQGVIDAVAEFKETRQVPIELVDGYKYVIYKK